MIKEMDSEIKKRLSSPEFYDIPIEIKASTFIFKDIISDKGKKSVVILALDEYGGQVAIKLATDSDYLERSFLEELERASQLRNDPHFTTLILAGKINYKGIKLTCFVESYIEGVSLAHFIKNSEITSSFIINYVRNMCEILNILKENDLRHNDLHFGNVMIERPIKGSLTEEYRIKLIDIGSIKNYSEPVMEKKFDDHEWFALHLTALLNSMLLDSNQIRKSLSLKERKFRQKAIPLIKSMLDDDKQMALLEPSKILSQFEYAYVRSMSDSRDEEEKLGDPFDYISAEHIESDRMLVKLFAESCPWMEHVIGPNPVLLTGPRGCGKSMLFRRISLKANLFIEDSKKIEMLSLAGFYVSCSADFRNRFGNLSEGTCKRFQKTIVHYFNLLLSHEIIQTLTLIAERNDRESLFGFGKEEERKLYAFIINKLDDKQKEMIRLQGVTPMEKLLEIVENQLDFCYSAFLYGRNISSATSLAYLSDLTRHLKKNISFFENRTITFLLDDFSVHRISLGVQSLLNNIIWDRQASHIFKLSAEKHGIERSMIDPTRELREIDCGQYYMKLSDDNNLGILVNFAKDLLDHRLQLSGYHGDTESLIGHSRYGKGNLGKSLRYKKKNKYNYYYGIETIAEICTGDISILLEVYRRIFRNGKVSKDTRTMIGKDIQHAAIVSTSKQFLDLIKTFSPFGEEMYEIASYFGSLCSRILLEGKEKSPEVPFETTRLEVEQARFNTESWTDIQSQIMKELIRRSVFIEMELGAGVVLGTTLRWQLRRIYCPAINSSLNRNTSIKWNSSDFKYFITNPKEKCEHEFKKWAPSKPIASGQKKFE